jgi:hypothetical protein
VYRATRCSLAPHVPDTAEVSLCCGDALSLELVGAATGFVEQKRPVRQPVVCCWDADGR